MTMGRQCQSEGLAGDRMPSVWAGVLSVPLWPRILAVATARDPETLRLLQAQHPGQVMPLALDVTRRDQIQQVVDHVIGTLGRIDGLINNAGYGYRAAVEEGTPEEVDRLFQTNFFGPVALIQAVLPPHSRQRAGAIVNISSIAAVNTFPGSGYYGASKCALRACPVRWRRRAPGHPGYGGWNRGLPDGFLRPFLPAGGEGHRGLRRDRQRRRIEHDHSHGTQPGDPDWPGWCWRPSRGPSPPSAWFWGRTPGKCTPRPPRPTSPLWNLGWRRAGRRPSHQTPFDRTGKEFDTMKRWTARLSGPPAWPHPGCLRKYLCHRRHRPDCPGHRLLTEGLPSGDRILIAYFSVPETDGVDTRQRGQPGGGGRTVLATISTWPS